MKEYQIIIIVDVPDEATGKQVIEWAEFSIYKSWYYGRCR